MKQYLAAKARYPRHLLFFRIGDFYEMFFDDAKTAARALSLTLTSRNKGPDAIPMAGVPVHSAEQYLARLLRQGFSVAVCDQTEDAAQAKGLVKRDVTRVVTPGTVLEDSLLDSRKPNRIAAILPGGVDVPARHAGSTGLRAGGARAAGGDAHPTIYGLASADLTSGSIHIQEIAGDAELRSELARLAPSECLLPEDPPLPAGQKAPPLLPEGAIDSAAALSRLKPAAFDPREAHPRVIERFSEHGRDRQAAARLRALAKSLPLAFSAAGALVGYIEETFAGGKLLLSAPQAFDPEAYLGLGDSAIRSLELVETLRNRASEGSLLSAIDQTRTGPGSRLLREWLLRPLRSLERLRQRQDAVAALVENPEQRADVRDRLKELADLERIAARLFADKALPRDLLALHESLRVLPTLAARLSDADGLLGGTPPPTPPLRGEERLPLSSQERGSGGEVPGAIAYLPELVRELDGFDELAELIAVRLKPACSNVLTEGGLINDGVDAELDRLRTVSSGGKEWIGNFESAEAKRSGIGSLKVGYNRVFGYYIEVSRANQKRVPPDYERRQTLTNAERYTTPQLKEREAEVLGAEEKICALEQKLFLKLRDEVAAQAARIHAAGRALAALDALCSLAEVAHKRHHVRPLLSNSGTLLFEQMRHPVLEAMLPKGELVPNDLALDAGRMPALRAETGETPALRDPEDCATLPSPPWGEGGASAPGEGAALTPEIPSSPAIPAPQILLLTGPNMAGKSTYIRAAALCTILAQMGAFVPAEKAEVGLVDRVFTRVGAADDLAGGRSTFMLEMTEVAEILAACSDRSLVVLDEVGRGTSTYDGVSLAWALVEHLHDGQARPRTLFATHYHELCALEEELPRVRNACAAVKEWQGQITFLHRIVAGPSERSFGIHVARLAGLPAPLIERARAILAALEKEAAGRVDELTDGGAQVGSSGGAQGEGKARGRARGKLKRAAQDGQLQLFDPNPEILDPRLKAALDELRAADAQHLTPLQALALLDKLARQVKNE